MVAIDDLAQGPLDRLGDGLRPEDRPRLREQHRLQDQGRPPRRPRPLGDMASLALQAI
jgi:hypothetical protein